MGEGAKSGADRRDWLLSYLPRLVRWGGLSAREREFCIALLGRRRRRPGFVPSARQEQWLDDLVARFREAEFAAVREARHV